MDGSRNDMIDPLGSRPAARPAPAERDAPAGGDLFRLLVESALDYAIFALDTEGRVRTWNLGAQRIKGYRADEIIGRHFSVFYPDEDVRAGKCERELECAKREGRYQEEGWRTRRRAGGSARTARASWRTS
jgi:PAS domain S-box-containing protein